MGRNVMSVLEQLKTDMSIHAQSEYPLEACGLVTKDFKYVPCKNISPLPKDSFILDPISLLEYEYNTWGIFHSHPGSENPLPSEEDLKHAIFDEYKFVVGFAGKHYIYWFDKQYDMLRYEPFEEEHLIDNSKIS